MGKRQPGVHLRWPSQFAQRGRGAEIFRLRTWTPHSRVAWIQGIGRGELRLEAARLISDGGGLSGLAWQNVSSLSLSTPRRRPWRVAVLLFRTYRSLDTLLYTNTTALAAARWHAASARTSKP